MATSTPYENQKKSIKPKSTKNVAEDVIGKSTVGLSTGDISRKIDLLKDTQNTVDTSTKFKVNRKDINEKRIKDKGFNQDIDSDSLLGIAADDYTIEKNKEATAKIEVLESTDRKFYLGEKIIGISPFDNYFLFNIYKEVDEEDVPVDLSTAGTIYLSFGTDDEEVRVSNYTNTDDADISQGQVIFRLDKTNARKVLAFQNNNFYITARMEAGDDTSDETVIYYGKFYPFDELYENTLRAEYEELKDRTSLHINLLEEKIHDLERDLNMYKTDYEKMFQLNRELEKTNAMLMEAIGRLKKKLSAEDVKEVEQKELESAGVVTKTKEVIKKTLSKDPYVPSPEPRTTTTKTKDLGSTGARTARTTEAEITKQAKRQKVKTTQTNFNTTVNTQVNTDK